MLNANSPSVVDFLKVWQENDYMFGVSSSMEVTWEDHLKHSRKHAIEMKKYIHLNHGESGHFLVNRKTHEVYSISSYGVPNKRKYRGRIEFLTEFIKEETAAGREYTHRYWYALHPTE